MRTLALVILFFAMLSGEALAGSIPFTTIDQSLVAYKMLPVGTEVKIKVLQISDQFNSKMTVVCFPESPFKAGTPGTASFELKQWLAKDIQVGDVLRYTTTRRGFIGFSAGPDYRKLYMENLEGGYRLTMDYHEHRWLVDVSFPDYD
ncbi:MAG: hypothetical protein HGA96_12525 [Desulfobulbaceae bacterium]|nr:hypothetical protein [Desulfobulbaceae bacterium]